MKQLAFGLPPIESIPRTALPAYNRLLATIHSAGWRLRSVQEAQSLGGPFLELKSFLSIAAPPRDNEVFAEGFEIHPSKGGCVLTAHDRSLSSGLEEIRRQFTAIYIEGIQSEFRSLRCRPRVPLRGIRIDLETCARESVVYDLEKYADYGINALLIDPLDPPSSNGELTDETRSAGWESRLRHTLEVFGKRGWWRMPVLPFELDLASERPGETDWTQTPLCRQDPRSRRRLLHRFESIVRLLPQVEAVGLSVTEWGRCSCDICARTSFQEEVAYYVRGYLAVLKRFAPDTELWILPDEIAWEALQEVGLQVPEPVRWLYSSEGRRMEGFRRDAEWGADGIQFLLPEGARGGYLAPEFFAWLETASEGERELRLAVATAALVETPPVQFAAFLRSVWEIEGDSSELEEGLFRLVLPSSEWRHWKDWKAENDLLKGCFEPSMKYGGGGLKPENNESLGFRNGRSTARGNGEADLRDRISTLAARNGGTPYSLSPGPHLIAGLVAGAKRWLAERELEILLGRLRAMPETAPIDGRLQGRIADLRDALNEFLDSPSRSQFELEELRGLESLRDHLALHLGRERRQEVWSKKDLPTLWIDLPSGVSPFGQG